MPRRISMRDLAKEAGVSVMTVSLALRKSPKISQSVRERIEALATERGYWPDPALRALADYRLNKRNRAYHGTIIYINNTDQDNVTKSVRLHNRFFMGAQEQAEKLGYKVEEFWLKQRSMTPERASKILCSRGVDGLLVGPQAKPYTTLHMDWEKFSAVAFGFSLASPRLHTVIANLFNSVWFCMREMCSLGYRRIGMVLEHHQDDRTEHRYIGAYKAAQESLPSVFPRLPILRADALTEDSFNAWFDENKPDGLLSLNHTVIGFLNKRGLGVPEDIGYSSPFSITQYDHISHVDGSKEEVGVAAMAFLSSMIDRNEKGIPKSPRNLFVDPIWVPGKTLRKVGPPIEI